MATRNGVPGMAKMALNPKYSAGGVPDEETLHSPVSNYGAGTGHSSAKSRGSRERQEQARTNENDTGGWNKSDDGDEGSLSPGVEHEGGGVCKPIGPADPDTSIYVTDSDLNVSREVKVPLGDQDRVPIASPGQELGNAPPAFATLATATSVQFTASDPTSLRVAQRQSTSESESVGMMAGNAIHKAGNSEIGQERGG